MSRRTTAARCIWYLFIVPLLFAAAAAVFGIQAFPIILCLPFVAASLLFAVVYGACDSRLVWRVSAAATVQSLCVIGIFATPTLSVSAGGAHWQSIITLPGYALVACWIVGSLLPPVTTIVVLCLLRKQERASMPRLAAT